MGGGCYLSVVRRQNRSTLRRTPVDDLRVRDGRRRPTSSATCPLYVDRIEVRSAGHLSIFCECSVRGNVIIYRAQKAIQGDGCRPRRRSRPRSPPLAPIRNSSESRGLCCRSCFGPRTCGRGITNSSKRRSSQSGFPLLAPTMQAGQDSDGRVGGSEEMCTLQAVTVWWFWH
jgi:hypothetical protein